MHAYCYSLVLRFPTHATPGTDPRGWGGSPEDGLTIPEQEALKEEAPAEGPMWHHVGQEEGTEGSTIVSA